MAVARTEDPDTGYRHYTYPPTGEQLVSVTTVNSATLSKPYLVPWSARIAAEYAVDNLVALARVKRVEGRDAAVRLAKEQAELLRIVKREAGGYVHRVVESLVLWAADPQHGPEVSLPLLAEHLEHADYDDQPLHEVVDWMIRGFCNWVSDFAPEFEAAEMTVFNVRLGIAGTLDLIVRLHGVAIGPSGRLVPAPGNVLTLCVDVKTGKYTDASWRRQIATYRRMPECAAPLSDEPVPMIGTDAGAVLHLRPEYPNGYRLMLISGADDQAAWAGFCHALESYRDYAAAGEKPGKVVYYLRGDGTMPQPLIRDLDSEGYGRAISPLVKTMGAGADLEQLAAMTSGRCLQIKGVGPKVLDAARRMLADHGLHFLDETPPITPAKAA